MAHFRDMKIYYKAMHTKYGVVFLVVLLIFIVLFICFLICSQHKFEQSQNQIKELYVEHIQKADSLYLNLVTYNRNIVDGIQNATAKTLADSMIKVTLANTRSLTRTQSDKLSMIIKTHFDEVESIHQKYDERLLRDSLRLNTERELLNGQTKTMIDLHLNKIEHEYSNITMWAAVLTIIFLVFSFYSIFKMDELIQQGNDGVKEIRQLKTQGEKTIEDLNTNGNNLLEDIKIKIRRFIFQQQRSMMNSNAEFERTKENIEQRYNESIQNLNQAQELFNQRGGEILRNFEIQMEDLRRKKEQEFDNQRGEFKRLIEELNNILDHLKSQTTSGN